MRHSNVPLLGQSSAVRLPVHPQTQGGGQQYSTAPPHYHYGSSIPQSPVVNPVIHPTPIYAQPHDTHSGSVLPHHAAVPPMHTNPLLNNAAAITKCMIKIVSVQNLPRKVGAFDRTDPMIELSTPGYSFKTRVMKNSGSEATFNESTTVTLPSDRIVGIKVYDFNHIQKNTLLCAGSFLVPATFEPNQTIRVNLMHSIPQNQTTLGDAVVTIELLGTKAH